MRYSVLDLAPVPQGHDTATAIANSRDLAIAAERMGYHRYWLAEHHNMPGIASAATAVLIGHIAEATTTMRIGAGGVMLPNHAPLTIAEQFGTLATIHPGRIDLGLGRAPGGDMAVARALRRGLEADRFPDDVVELMGYFADADPAAPVSAHPGQGTHVPVWILGSSLYGAQLAAHLGLPYAFASHFAPDALDQALDIYRTRFQPSAQLDRPYFMLAANVFAADTDAEGAFLRTSMQQAFARLRTGQPGKLPAPVQDIEAAIGPQMTESVNHALSVSATGSPATVRAQLGVLKDRYQPDEIILTGQIHDHAARVNSFRIAAEILQDMTTADAA
ncbi:LLM class flavin-dependent oxidoreductase [Roseovarius atlanticus]|uniref:LLM class flavin-dependent oxidoreductase n=1 Tax=Roseovarius atlanticus TaxID=1641875 RepID=UPI001C947E5E|nr:LLM class flavin-dependent oxidoreductase [Roseovarius atlanticus]MBY5990030.1 LLM class flavin-dependent oxidoreductase [Roseovarius atlanticus]MBY6126575.1 LLM class flavin-dependent oxidoreductase [Roseovarius atlanticus]MBY6151069.1 LLM class flavin-dependent oxidoreductase [Roseovarius atlanticus]